ncbi:hypothetical protein IF2G_00683 [Cordyceps javanica]|nr:hypothetical protein IF2G_00683 [Cordyceps javanica]
MSVQVTLSSPPRCPLPPPPSARRVNAVPNIPVLLLLACELVSRYAAERREREHCAFVSCLDSRCIHHQATLRAMKKFGHLQSVPRSARTICERESVDAVSRTLYFNRPITN